MAVRNDIAMLVIHHQRKPNKADESGSGVSAVAGTGGLTAAADAILSLNKKGGSVTLQVTSGDAAEAEYPLERDANRGWKVLGKTSVTKPAACKRWLICSTKEDQMCSSDIEAAFPEQRSGTVRSWLTRAKQADKIEETGFGKLAPVSPGVPDELDEPLRRGATVQQLVAGGPSATGVQRNRGCQRT